LIVVDASAIVELLLNTPLGRIVSRRIQSAETVLHAPHLLDLEVTQVLRRFAATGVIDDARALASLHALRDLDLERHSHEPLLDRIWALRSNLTAYDAAYVALAEALDTPVLTCDGKLAASHRLAARIELVRLVGSG